MTAPLSIGPRPATVETALLTVDGLSAGYGKARVLDGVSFSIGREAVCVVGRNGMGKSTLCNTIMGLVHPTAGTIRFDGADIAGMPPEKVARRGIALRPPGAAVVPVVDR